MSKSYHVDANHNKVVVAILTSDKVDSEKSEKVDSGYYQRDKMSFPNDEGVIPSIEHNNPKYHALKNKALKYMKWKLIQMQREVDKSLIVARDFNIPPSIINRINRE